MRFLCIQILSGNQFKFSAIKHALSMHPKREFSEHLISIQMNTSFGHKIAPKKKRNVRLQYTIVSMNKSLELVSGNCCVLIQTNVGNCAFNVKMKKHCAQFGRCKAARPLPGIAMDGVGIYIYTYQVPGQAQTSQRVRWSE